RVWGYTASEHYVVLHDSATQRVLLFTTDGKYLNDIGSRGQGPGEYSFVDCWTMKISPDEKHILLRLAWYSGIFNMYNIDGSFIKKCIIPPVRGREFGYFGTDNFVSIKQSSDLSKTGGNKLLIFDKEINLTDSLMLSYDDANMVTGKGFLNNVYIN
ncbi:MAG: 6-bladed beta-propeller, partial [Bacteroidetes bacterium]|nr:6-bladed beta-propeller [Bacteroidota bacterium]